MSKIWNGFEEFLIAFILGAMTLLTFVNVVVRYVFNGNILFALELTVFLFGWLVLFGASYAVKKNLHLGVDAIVGAAPRGLKRALGLIVVAICLAYSLLLLKAAWDYWAPFAGLPPTDGRWFPTGFAEKFRSKSYIETNDIPMIDMLRWLEPLILHPEDDPYTKLPRVIPYIVLPLAMLMLTVRFIQAAIKIATGKVEMLIASHEAEEEVAAASAVVEKAEQNEEKR